MCIGNLSLWSHSEWTAPGRSTRKTHVRALVSSPPLAQLHEGGLVRWAPSRDEHTSSLQGDVSLCSWLTLPAQTSWMPPLPSFQQRELLRRSMRAPPPG